MKPLEQNLAPLRYAQHLLAVGHGRGAIVTDVFMRYHLDWADALATVAAAILLNECGLV
jgi:hypothetical protein